MLKKLKVGWFAFTCSEDSTIVFTELLNDNYFKWKKLIDFRHFRALMERSDIKNLDVAFIEGAITGKNEEKELKEIRKNCKKLIAVGSCACTGSPSNQRNNFTKEQLEEIKPILNKFEYRKRVSAVSEIVKVDDSIPGCPMDEKIFMQKLEDLLKEFGVSNA